MEDANAASEWHEAASGTDRRFSVHVLATTQEGTRCALLRAKRLTEGLNARVVVLAPRVTSWRQPFDPATPDRADTVDAYRALAASVGVDVTVLFCVCRRPDDIVKSMLGPSSLVIIGGRHRVAVPSREERLVTRLSAAGYLATFVALDRRGEATAKATE